MHTTLHRVIAMYGPDGPFNFGALSSVAFSTLVALLSAPALAQYSGGNGMYFSNMYAANANMYAANTNMILGQMIRDANMKQMQAAVVARTEGNAGGQARAATSLPAAAPKSPITATDFRPAGRRDVPQQMAQAATHADRAQLIKVCRDVQAMIEAEPGFRRNNVSYAIALLIGVSVQVAHGVNLSDAESDQLVRVLNDTLADMADYQRLAPEARTRLNDTSVITGGLIAGIAQTGQETGNAELRSQAQAMARDALASFGFTR